MYKKINLDVDIGQLQNETTELFSRKEIFSVHFPSQLGLTYEDESCENKFGDGVGSLDWDYTLWTPEQIKAGLHPPARTRKVTEQDFNKIVPELQGFYIYDLLKLLQEKYNIGRTRLMLSNPKTCLSWHRDSTYRMHIPIFTQEGCFMAWNDCTLHMPEGSCYWTDTTVPHTAFNGSFKERIHLVATVEKKLNEI